MYTSGDTQQEAVQGVRYSTDMDVFTQKSDLMEWTIQFSLQKNREDVQIALQSQKQNAANAELDYVSNALSHSTLSKADLAVV